jgi:hypothetical protein
MMSTVLIINIGEPQDMIEFLINIPQKNCYDCFLGQEDLSTLDGVNGCINVIP